MSKEEKENQNSKKYKPDYGRVIIASFLFIISVIIFLLVSIFVFKQKIVIITNIEEFQNEKLLKQVLLLIKQMTLWQLLRYILFVLAFIVSLISLALIILKDDCSIRYAKLNELACIEEKLEQADMSKNNLELLKKYMDTIAEI